MSLGLRTIKITLAATIAIYIAQFIGLENSLATGIITILTLLDTRKASRQISLTYLIATVLAFAIATVIFLIFGFQVWAFGLYLLIFIPVAYRMNLQAAIAPISVLVTHFVIAESVSWQWQLNGVLIMVIGAGMAILFNLWMPNQKLKLKKGIKEIEENFRVVLELINQRLLENDFDIPLIRAEVEHVDTSIEDFRQLALSEYENQIFTKDDYFIRYAQMRSRQADILKRMIDSLQHISLRTEQNTTLANMFKLTSDEFAQTNSGKGLLESISELYSYYRSSDLPKNREEFETRALLYHILIEFERFLEIKHKFYLDKHIRKF